MLRLIYSPYRLLVPPSLPPPPLRRLIQNSGSPTLGVLTPLLSIVNLLTQRIAATMSYPAPFGRPNRSDAITREAALWWRKETSLLVTSVVACPALLRDNDLSPKV
ncbi:hypothetical protein PoB_005795600 [Plakobranchus ocellatus]|uniref:Uncharacterized protein n=1 Tax=Plakobranchus ocellatus TaxID=259542 RepID=A0AAV4C818_9GAST|nr:hypothetical protein PoB_005795600 [Plakobranchus ocellatus]